MRIRRQAPSDASASPGKQVLWVESIGLRRLELRRRFFAHTQKRSEICTGPVRVAQITCVTPWEPFYDVRGSTFNAWFLAHYIRRQALGSMKDFPALDFSQLRAADSLFEAQKVITMRR